MKTKYIGRVACVLLVVATTGCSGSRQFEDLQAFMDQVESQPKAPIEPLPEFLPYQAFAYGAGDMRSPFEPPQKIQPVDRRNATAVVKPDPNRVKQYLEQFQIGQLRMVGTLSRDANLYALIQDANGGVHRVQSGDYMGTDHGKVRGINENQIELIEIVSDGTGGWVQRARTLTIGAETKG
jgi:type IV pilus assembly protein PilP